MKAHIRTLEKCPKCKGKFIKNDKGLICPQCLTTPKRFYIDIYWNNKRWRIFRTKSKHKLSSYDLAQSVANELMSEMQNNYFCPDNYDCQQNKYQSNYKLSLKKSDNSWIIERWYKLNPRERQAIIFTVFKGKCYYCNRQVSIPLVRRKNIDPLRCVMDHRIPFAHGGSDTFDNVVLSCHECNMKKGERDYKEWIENN